MRYDTVCIYSFVCWNRFLLFLLFSTDTGILFYSNFHAPIIRYLHKEIEKRNTPVFVFQHFTEQNRGWAVFRRLKISYLIFSFLNDCDIIKDERINLEKRIYCYRNSHVFTCKLTVYLNVSQISSKSVE